MIPDQILDLFQATYEFIYSQILDGTNWQDSLSAVKFRQESFAGSYGIYNDLLPLLTYAAIGGETREAIPLAAAWALYDLASEIFDDVQDRDEKSRPWNRWHPSQATGVALGLVASGNICLALLQAPHDALSDTLESWSHALILAARDQWNDSQVPSLEQYFRRTITKSGLIYGTVARAGGRLRTNEPSVLEALYDYGMGLGMITQIWDDCLDLAPDQIKSDLVAGTYTLPVIYALSLKDDFNYPELVALLSSPEGLTPTEIETIRCVLEKMGAISYCTALMKAYEQKALNALAIIREGQYVTHLEDYVSAFLLFPNTQPSI